MSRPTWIEIGYVARPQGVRGDVRVRLYNAGTTILDEVESVTLEGPGELPRRACRILSSQPRGEDAQLQLEGIGDRNAAEALVGAKVFVDRALLPELEDGEFYHFDLIGLKAVDEAGAEVGKLEEIFSTPAHDIYVIRGGKAGEILVPAVGEFVGDVDLEAGRITLKRLDDLLEE